MKKTAENEAATHFQLGKSYESVLENGVTIHVSITMDASGVTPQKTEKALSEFAKCSRNFYLEAGRDLNNTP